MTQPTGADVAQDIVNKLSGALEKVADKTGEIAPRAWEVAVQRQVTEGVTDLIVCSALAIALVLAYMKLVRASKGMRDEFDRTMALAVVGIVAAIAAVPCWFFARGGVYHILNPEYYAAIELLGAVK